MNTKAKMCDEIALELAKELAMDSAHIPAIKSVVLPRLRESRECALREAAELVATHRDRFIAQAKEALAQGDVLLGHRQLVADMLEGAILSLITKEAK